MRNCKSADGEVPKAKILPVAENFPRNRALHFIAQCFLRQRVRVNWNVALSKQNINASRVVAVFMRE